MLNLIRPIARKAIPRVTTTQIRTAGGGHGHGHSDFKYVTFDEACKPEGSWKENYEKRQRRYNTQLLVGVSAFVLSVVTIVKGELIFFNYEPPKPKI